MRSRTLAVVGEVALAVPTDGGCGERLDEYDRRIADRDKVPSKAEPYPTDGT